MLCDRLAELDLGFPDPVVLDRGAVDGVPFFVEERMTGQDMAAALPQLDGAAASERSTPISTPSSPWERSRSGRRWWGEVLADEPVRAPTWVQFLCDRVRASAAAAAPRVRADLPELDRPVADFCEEVTDPRVGTPQLVHGDFFPET